MHDSIFFVLQADQSSQAPRLQWTGGSPAASALPTWPPPPPTGFWSPSGPDLWHLPIQPYPGQPRGHPPTQMSQGYWPLSPPWGSPPGEHVPQPFSSPPFRSPLLRPTTSMPPMVRNYFTILTRPFHNPNMSIYMSFRVAQDHKAVGRDMTLLTPSSTRREDPAATTRCHSHSLL
jgi:hypothetical protein